MMNQHSPYHIVRLYRAARFLALLTTICCWFLAELLFENSAVVRAQTFCPRSPQSIHTISQGIIGNPRLNSTGRRVTFESSQDLVSDRNTDGNIEIFYSDITNLDSTSINPSSTVYQLTDTNGNLFGGLSLAPSINGAGNYILFSSDDDPSEDDSVFERENGQYELFLGTIQSDHAVSMTLVSNMGFPRVGMAMNPAFNADGSRAVYLANNILHFDIATFGFPNLDGSTEVFLLDGDLTDSTGFTTTMLTDTTLNEYIAQPNISADGTHVAYVYGTDLAYQGDIGTRIKILDTDTSALFELEEPSGLSAGHHSDPHLSQDGSRITYVVTDPETGMSEVWFFDEQESLYRQISTGGYNQQPSISDDGTRVAYVRIDPVNLQHSVYLYNKTNNSNTLLSNTTAYNEQPVISGDGTTIAFVGFGNSVSSFDDAGMGLYMAYCP